MSYCSSNITVLFSVATAFSMAFLKLFSLLLCITFKSLNIYSDYLTVYAFMLAPLSPADKELARLCDID